VNSGPQLVSIRQSVHKALRYQTFPCTDSATSYTVSMYSAKEALTSEWSGVQNAIKASPQGGASRRLLSQQPHRTPGTARWERPRTTQICSGCHN